MASNLLAMLSHWPQSYFEARGQMVFFEAFEAKSSLWKKRPLSSLNLENASEI